MGSTPINATSHGPVYVSIDRFCNIVHIEAYTFFKMYNNIKWRRIRYGRVIEKVSISQLSNTEMFR